MKITIFVIIIIIFHHMTLSYHIIISRIVTDSNEDVFILLDIVIIAPMH